MEPSTRLLLFALLPLLLAVSRGQDVTCRDEKGNAVDWFVLYKLPRLHTSPVAAVQSGLGYVFLTSASTAPGWTLGAFDVKDARSPPGRTLAPIYDATQRDAVLRVLYNDQPPALPVSFTHGHTKGVVLAGHAQGLWLVHSVPHFPPDPSTSGFGYPDTGEHYGQTMMCITLPNDQMDTVGTQLTFNHPFVYSSLTPENVSASMPELARAAKGEHVTQAPFFHKAAIESVGGQQFTSFAKASQFGKDLYADWLTQELQASLMVESWPNGPGRLPPSCNMNFKVVNILSLNISASNENVAEFKDQQDHSKWAIQNSRGSTTWACVGDINRMESQEQRAGGTVCLNAKKVWSVFKNAIVDTEKCAGEDFPRHHIAFPSQP